MTDDLRERVQAELKRQGGWSARKAAAEATARAGREVASNQTLSRFLNDGEVTAKVREGFAYAFDWPMDWPENPPPLPVTEIGQDAVETILLALAAMSESAQEVLENIDSRLTGIERHLKKGARESRAPRDRQADD
jgi:DNA-binding TFAR19-related protein (PDSD5 family)